MLTEGITTEMSGVTDTKTYENLTEFSIPFEDDFSDSEEDETPSLITSDFLEKNRQNSFYAFTDLPISYSREIFQINDSIQSEKTSNEALPLPWSRRQKRTSKVINSSPLIGTIRSSPSSSPNRISNSQNGILGTSSRSTSLVNNKYSSSENILYSPNSPNNSSNHLTASNTSSLFNSTNSPNSANFSNNFIRPHASTASGRSKPSWEIGRRETMLNFFKNEKNEKDQKDKDEKEKDQKDKDENEKNQKDENEKDSSNESLSNKVSFEDDKNNDKVKKKSESSKGSDDDIKKKGAMQKMSKAVASAISMPKLFDRQSRQKFVIFGNDLQLFEESIKERKEAIPEQIQKKEIIGEITKEMYLTEKLEKEIWEQTFYQLTEKFKKLLEEKIQNNTKQSLVSQDEEALKTYTQQLEKISQLQRENRALKATLNRMKQMNVSFLEEEQEKYSSENINTENQSIQFIQYQDKKVIKSGNKQSLISYLWTHSIPDYPNYIPTFLLTFPTFMTPIELFSSLSKEYSRANEDLNLSDDEIANRKARTCSILKIWIETYWKRDLQNDSHIQEQLKIFLNSFDPTNYTDKTLQVSLFNTIEKVQSQKPMIDLKKMISTQTKQNIGFDSLKSREIAQQITLIDFEIFSMIETSELLTLNFLFKDKQTQSPRVKKMTQIFNQTSAWVTCSILKEKSLTKRKQILKKFIQISRKFYDIGNFNGIFQIVAGLTSQPIFRLKATWEDVEKDKNSFWPKALAITSSEQNYAFYKRKLAKFRGRTVLPFLGITLSALTFIAEGNPDNISTEEINFFKRVLISKIINEIQSQQRRKYDFSPHLDIRDYLLKQRNELFSENELYSISKALE